MPGKKPDWDSMTLDETIDFIDNDEWINQDQVKPHDLVRLECDVFPGYDRYGNESAFDLGNYQPKLTHADMMKTHSDLRLALMEIELTPLQEICYREHEIMGRTYADIAEGLNVQTVYRTDHYSVCDDSAQTKESVKKHVQRARAKIKKALKKIADKVN